MTIQEIIKKTLMEVKSRGQNLTPDIYTDLFCKEAKKANVIVEDCQRVEKFLKKLPPELQRDLKKRHVATVDQLVQYLAAELSRSDSKGSSEIIRAYLLLAKRLLQAITLLHDKEAAAMAEEDRESLGEHSDRAQIDAVRERWNRFVMDYSDAFLQRLDPYCKVDKTDLESMVDDIVDCFRSSKRVESPHSSEALDTVAQVVIASLSPSIASGMDDELATISSQIRSNPELLTSDAMIEDLKHMVRKRIELDKKAVVDRIGELDTVIEHINLALTRVIDSGEGNKEALGVIQGELESIDLKADSFEAIHKKLLAVATSLERETRTLSEEMYRSRERINELQEKVRILESALHRERKKSATDTLTKLPNRRGLDESLAKMEAAFKRYNDNYSVVLFDLDHFKSINDTYGHDAGDMVLASFAKQLRRYSRELDIVGRWGGEEFLVILPKTDREGAGRFAEKLREVVEKSKFLYRGRRIPVTVSGGVADRSSYGDMERMLKAADEKLYLAKEGGRNRVVV
ncbi:GGDEF domain protein [Hydrogenimonas sp.]|nr:GGDEF domain protein [Hydrogenimonas sp.]